MAPFLNPGDWIGVEWREAQSPTQGFEFIQGQIVLARDSQSQEWLVHRLIKKDRQTKNLWIKGDTSFAWDQLSVSDIWGQVVAIRAPEILFSPNWLDSWIARFSEYSLSPNPMKARIARRIVYFLALGRRKWLNLLFKISS